MVAKHVIILASTSPRRKELLAAAGISFYLCPPGVNETFDRGDFARAEDVALELALRKARAVSWKYPGRVVLGADTLVETETGEILGRPFDRLDARRMIGLLAGRVHHVHTAIALCRDRETLEEIDTAEVKFRDLSAEEIDRYVNSGEGDDKAGAYGYQNEGRTLVESVTGDPQTVIGLPIRLVRKMLAQVAAFFICVTMSHAQEVRDVRLTIGEPTAISLGAASLRSGDTSVITSWRDNTLTIVARDPAPRALIFSRPSGETVLIRITVGSVEPPARVPTSGGAVFPSGAMVRRVRFVEPVPPTPPVPPPPIIAPPAPLVLRTPPVGIASPSPRRSDVSTRTSTVSVVPIEIPTRVVEQTVPVGSDAPSARSLFDQDSAKPAELSLFTLATDLMNRGLYAEAIDQFRRLLVEFPRTTLREQARINIGESFRRRAEEGERESLRQRDLRRSGLADDALNRAIADYASALAAFREVVNTSPKSENLQATQLAIAQSMHGLARTQFQKGGIPQDSPAVVVEYLRAIVGGEDTVSPQARLGIAQYHRDLGDARLLARDDRARIQDAYERAVAEYRTIISEAPNSSAAEEALIDLARLFDRNLEMRRFNDAVRYYEELLTRFPASRYASEARERSRWIRENYL